MYSISHVNVSSRGRGAVSRSVRFGPVRPAKLFPDRYGRAFGYTFPAIGNSRQQYHRGQLFVTNGFHHLCNACGDGLGNRRLGPNREERRGKSGERPGERGRYRDLSCPKRSRPCDTPIADVATMDMPE
jgi:hypothetical protein